MTTAPRAFLGLGSCRRGNGSCTTIWNVDDCITVWVVHVAFLVQKQLVVAEFMLDGAWLTLGKIK